MKITCISKIKKHRIFCDFTWPQGVQDFGHFNLIFGWNGCGKTTLSNLFRCIEKREAILEGEVLFKIDGRDVAASSLSSGLRLPQAKVFNRDFVAGNVFASTQAAISPIFFLGEDSIQKQKEIEKLKIQLNEQEIKIAKKQSDLDVALNLLDRFCIQHGKTIKDLLSSSGENTYNNYDKRSFRNACDILLESDANLKLLTEDEKNDLKRQKESTPKDTLSNVSHLLPDLITLTNDIEQMLRTTVVSQVLDELARNSALATWVREGLGHHTGSHVSDTCRFCGQRLPVDRLEELQGHFNDHYNSFIKEIGDKIHDLQSSQNCIVSAPLPPKTALYDHLAGTYLDAVSVLKSYLEQVHARYTALVTALKEKQTKPFEVMTLESFIKGSAIPDANGLSQAVNAINDLIGQHNAQTDDFQQTINSARRKLEECLVAEALEDFQSKQRSVKEADEALRTFHSIKQQILSKKVELEKQVIEHRRPAEELDLELSSYLGRNELKFQVEETGYSITRHGHPAKDLSESERTAIAFLYFLKSLQDKDFDLKQGVVVVDDPVSSLDTTALFSAFGYMKERTKEVGQLFVLTHNATFFRQVKNWFNHLPGQQKSDLSQRPGRFFMISCSVNDGVRSSSITRLDPLLHQFDSDYHYLFKLIYDAIHCDPEGKELAQFYGLPNAARRLLESFLAFRYPGQIGDLRKQLDCVPFDAAKKSRIIRFLHTYSHEGRINEPEQDLSILAETPKVLKDLFELLRSEDPKHFEQMIGVVGSPQVQL